jgi:hypothetical protein
VPTEPIQHKALESLLRDNFGGAIFLRDRTYAPLAQKSIVGFSKWLNGKQDRDGLSYSKRWDCDNFAIDLVNELTKKHALQESESEAESVAVGWFFYKDDAIGPHCRVWFLQQSGELGFLEPITSTVVDLSQKERDSSWFVFG